MMAGMGVLLLIGAVFGVLAGWRFKTTHYAWFEWRKTVNAVPILRKIFYGSVRAVAGWAVAALILVIVAVH
jgi:hypothetical protein